MMLEHNHLARTFRAAASSGVPHLTWHGDSEMEAFEIGVSAFLAGYNMGEMGWNNQTEILKVGFNYNNWEKIKI
jgi:hypothetical protein